jgi:hypothetical protein
MPCSDLMWEMPAQISEKTFCKHGRIKNLQARKEEEEK